MCTTTIWAQPRDAPLEEDAQVLVEEDVGVEHDRAPGHLPCAIHLAQPSLPDVELHQLKPQRLLRCQSHQRGRSLVRAFRLHRTTASETRFRRDCFVATLLAMTPILAVI